MPRYRRYPLAGHPVFLTVVTHGRRPWLEWPGRAELLLAAMRQVRGQHAFRHLGHVVLPDHLHWLLEPADGDFSRIVAAVKREATWRLKECGSSRPPFWQSRFYDHVIRDPEDLDRHLDYIYYNPVKHGYVNEPGAWPASSFNAWVIRGRYTRDWGASEPLRIKGLELE